jgi:hypothetical protein
MLLERGKRLVVVGVFVCLCLASQKPSESEFFVPARTDLGVKTPVFTVGRYCLVWYYLQGLGTLFRPCHIVHVYYTCSHVTVRGMYHQSSTSSYYSYILIPKSRTHLKPSESPRSTKNTCFSNECSAHTMAKMADHL